MTLEEELQAVVSNYVGRPLNSRLLTEIQQEIDLFIGNKIFLGELPPGERYLVVGDPDFGRIGIIRKDNLKSNSESTEEQASVDKAEPPQEVSCQSCSSEDVSIQMNREVDLHTVKIITSPQSSITLLLSTKQILSLHEACRNFLTEF